MKLAEKVLHKAKKKPVHEGIEAATTTVEKFFDKTIGKDLVAEEIGTKKEVEVFKRLVVGLFIIGNEGDLVSFIRKAAPMFNKEADDETSD